MKMNDSTVDRFVRKCRRLARKLGGDIVVVDKLSSHLDQKDVYRCPFAFGMLAVDWPAKAVLITPDLSVEQMTGVIHEMGHALACSKPPNRSEEFDFLGWEYVAAQQLGVLFQWSRGNADYQTENGGGEWSKLTPAEQDDLMVERVKAAIEHGIMTKTLKLKSVRA